MYGKVSVLVVDDSALMRKMVSDMLEEDPDIKVVGHARNGEEAVLKVAELRPDVVLMDVQMPVLNGIEATKRIMASRPTPIIVFSAVTREDSRLTLKALDAGAIDVLAKPGGSVSLNVYDVKEELIAKVKAAARAPAIGLSRRRLREEAGELKKQALRLHPNAVVALAASTGGPAVLAEVLADLPLGERLAVLVVQHMPPMFTRELANRLNSLSQYTVKEAEDGDPVMGGCAYVAPGDYHMVVDRSASGSLTIRLEKGPKVNFVRPSADVTLMSLANSFQGPMVAAIMTGMGRDGCEGARAIKEAGGYVVVQDPSSCVVDGMPRVVMDAGLADAVAPPGLMASKVYELIRSSGVKLHVR